VEPADVGGNGMETKDGSRWEEYDSRACTSSVHGGQRLD
jgi:hypothetical protein